MENFRILAQAQTNQGSPGISSIPEGESPEVESLTKAEGSQDVNAPGPREKQPRSFFQSPMLPIILIFVVFYFLLLRGPRKKQQKQKKMVQSLKKNDRVRTIGGIIGTIVDVRDDEVTLKVDESNNTKIKISSSAIGRNLSKDEK